MDTHLSTEEIRSYLRRRLTGDDFDRVGEHVHSCEICYQVFLAELQRRFPIEIDLDELAGLKGWHLEGEELAAYVEGQMDELSFECASLHLEECGSCMERTSAAFEYRLENPRLRKSARRKQPSIWSKYLPGVQSIPSPRLQVAAAAVLVIALVLILWALIPPKPAIPQVADAPPAEKVSPDPSTQQPTAPVQVDPGADSHPSKGADGSMSNGLAANANSEKREVNRQEEAMERALIARDLVMPPAIEMLDRTPAIAVRGNPSFNPSFKIIGPFATLVKNDRPSFRWTELSGATSYTVSIFDAALNLIRTSERLTETQWLMPDSLEAGTVYTWMVTALKDGQEVVAPASPARAEFKILGKPELRKLNRIVRGTSSHAARGVLYAEAGLLDEAEMEFQTHLNLRPADEQVKGLLRIVKSWRAVT